MVRIFVILHLANIIFKLNLKKKKKTTKYNKEFSQDIDIKST